MLKIADDIWLHASAFSLPIYHAIETGPEGTTKGTICGQNVCTGYRSAKNPE
jgi:hypothetical protein